MQLKELTNEAEQMIIWGKPMAKILPRLLGQSESRTYLLLFQNDKELRPTGGFITAYGIFRLKNGKLEREGSDDIYNLDKTLTQKPPAPEPILKYLPGVYYWHLRDANLSPDFSQSMKNFGQLYQFSRRKIQYDGIVAIDSQFLVELLDVLGPTEAYGKIFHTDNDPRCDCPGVVYELQLMANNRRKDITGILVNATLIKSLSAPRELWLPLIKATLKAAEEKHLLIFLQDKDEQKAMETLGVTGRILDFEGDYLHINNVNFAGGKSNLYVKHFVKQEIKIRDDGSIVKTLTIEYRNPTPASACFNKTLPNWLRVYVPKGSQLLEFKGSEKETRTYEELGKTVFEGFLTVEPLGNSQIIIKYKLPFKLNKKEPYKLLIQKQAGTEDHDYEIFINGKKKEKFFLNKDRQLKFIDAIFP